jgi:AcrR family transcriptional regulator
MATDTRTRILDAALESFLELGYEQTTTNLVRERSGVSNGALFHHFATKEAIADALYVEAIQDFQAGLWQVLRQRPRSLRAAVRGVIAHHMAWIEANVDRARFVYARGNLDWDSPAGARLEQINRELADAYRAWMEPLVARGQVRRLSMLVITAIVTGPSHAIARRWLAGEIAAPLTSYVDELTDAACAALAGAPAAKARPSRTSQPRRSRLRLELVADDGRVVAEGEATAELTPTS